VNRSNVFEQMAVVDSVTLWKLLRAIGDSAQFLVVNSMVFLGQMQNCKKEKDIASISRLFIILRYDQF